MGEDSFAAAHVLRFVFGSRDVYSGSLAVRHFFGLMIVSIGRRNLSRTLV